jgi:hypothetical protein
MPKVFIITKTDDATMTIHPIRMDGLIIGVPQTYEYFIKIHFYVFC